MTDAPTDTYSDLNVVAISGTVRKVFDKSETKSGTANQTFSLQFKKRGYDRQVLVQAYGKVVDALNLSEGDYVQVKGELDEQRWQDKETEKWVGRHDLVAHAVVNLGPQDSDDDPFGD